MDTKKLGRSVILGLEGTVAHAAVAFLAAGIKIDPSVVGIPLVLVVVLNYQRHLWSWIQKEDLAPAGIFVMQVIALIFWLASFSMPPGIIACYGFLALSWVSTIIAAYQEVVK